MNPMKLFAAVVMGIGLNSYGQNPTFHTLTPTSAQKATHSYKFLTAKFGSGAILAECNYELAALLGSHYLYEVMAGSSTDPHGLTIGYGSTIQEALDGAETSYIPPDEVRRINNDLERMRREYEDRKQKYRNKCCKEQP